jgi:hypothetical protein
MAVKKKIELGPKAKLMKKNVDQLKRQAKKLKVQNYSTKKKEQLVNSIMMAEARAKRKPGTKRKKAAPKASAVKSVSTRVTMKGSGMKRKPMMRKPARNATRRPNKPMMAEYNGWPNYETWLMNLWYGDYFYSYVSEGIEDGWIDLETSRDPYELGNMLKDHVEELIEMEGQVPSSGFVADLFNGAMRDINWYSIGDSLISEL